MLEIIIYILFSNLALNLISYIDYIDMVDSYLDAFAFVVVA